MVVQQKATTSARAAAPPKGQQPEPDPSLLKRRGRRPSTMTVTKVDGGGPPWRVSPSNFKPTIHISDDELVQCKKTFFDLDRDGSGSIESDEIAFMLRSLGLNPTDKEVANLINKYDHSKDGKIQLREFMQIYSQSDRPHLKPHPRADTKRQTKRLKPTSHTVAAGIDATQGSEEDFLDAYRAVRSARFKPRTCNHINPALAIHSLVRPTTSYSNPSHPVPS